MIVWYQLTEQQRREIIISKGQNPDLPPRGVSGGNPPDGLRNWICAVDGHCDPDNTGGCIHCGADLDDYINADDLTAMLKDLGKAHKKSGRS